MSEVMLRHDNGDSFVLSPGSLLTIVDEFLERQVLDCPPQYWGLISRISRKANGEITRFRHLPFWVRPPFPNKCS